MAAARSDSGPVAPSAPVSCTPRERAHADSTHGNAGARRTGPFICVVRSNWEGGCLIRPRCEPSQAEKEGKSDEAGGARRLAARFTGEGPSTSRTYPRVAALRLCSAATAPASSVTRSSGELLCAKSTSATSKTRAASAATRRCWKGMWNTCGHTCGRRKDFG